MTALSYFVFLLCLLILAGELCLLSIFGSELTNQNVGQVNLRVGLTEHIMMYAGN